jgi:hypothetical protein
VKKIRKSKSAKQKAALRAAEDSLSTQTSQMMNHPKECCICNAVFERTQETVKTWQVTIREERVRLTCPKCWAILNEALEQISGN